MSEIQWKSYRRLAAAFDKTAQTDDYRIPLAAVASINKIQAFSVQNAPTKTRSAVKFASIVIPNDTGVQSENLHNFMSRSRPVPPTHVHVVADRFVSNETSIQFFLKIKKVVVT